MKDYGYFPKTKEDFNKYLEELESKNHTYETITDALTDATLAFFNYFAVKHDMTGYQCSWAELQFLKKSRGMQAPFMIVDSSKMLYPQYDLHKDLDEFLEDSMDELSKIAKENLDNNDGYISKRVLNRWKELVGYKKEMK